MGVGASTGNSKEWIARQTEYLQFYNSLMDDNNPAKLREIVPKVWPSIILWYNVYVKREQIPSEILKLANTQIREQIVDVNVNKLGPNLFDYLKVYFATPIHNVRVKDALLTLDFEHVTHIEITTLYPIPELPTPDNLREMFKEKGGFEVGKQLFYTSTSGFVDVNGDMGYAIKQLKPEQRAFWVDRYIHNPTVIEEVEFQEYVSKDHYMSMSPEHQNLFPHIKAKLDRELCTRQSNLLLSIQKRIDVLNTLVANIGECTTHDEMDSLEAEFELLYSSSDADDDAEEMNLPGDQFMKDMAGVMAQRLAVKLNED